MEKSSFLPNEIMVEILLRLPAMSIGRCRCVSKQWRSVLSQTHFIKKHLDRMRKLQQKSVILDSQSGSFYSITLSNTHQVLNEVTQPATKLNFTGYRDSWIWFIASCDGLVLVRGNSNFLLNPVTGEIREVAPLPFFRDPYNSYTSYGFGYDSVNDDYKIVILSYYNRCLKYDIEDPDMFVNVYSVKNCSWKKVESSPYDCAVGHFSSGVFVNGCIHWLAIHSSVILAFDLAKEKFHEVSTPNSIGESVLHYFVELRGCLCLFSKSYYDGTDVWIMKEYGNKDSWTMFTIIDPEMAQFGPISMLDQQHILLVKDKGTSDEKCVKYNLEKRTFKVIITHAIWDQFYYRGVFMESLVSPYSTLETS